MQVTVSSARNHRAPDGHEKEFLMSLINNLILDTLRTDLDIKCGLEGWRPETTGNPLDRVEFVSWMWSVETVLGTGPSPGPGIIVQSGETHEC